MGSVSDLNAGWGRDRGPVSTRSTSKGALVLEAHAVFRALGAGASIEEVRAACLTGRLLRQTARQTRNRIWESLHWRYFAWDAEPWVIADLANAARYDATDPRFVLLLYLHHARRDRLTFDFVTDKLCAVWQSKGRQIDRDDLLDFLVEYEAQDEHVKKWRESTRKKLAGNVLSALRDFGLLRGVQRKVLQRPNVPPEVTLHLCRLLHGEGLRGRALMQARDFRLFLWEMHDTALAFGQLAQRGDIRFERSGKTVILDVSEHPRGDQ